MKKLVQFVIWKSQISYCRSEAKGQVGSFWWTFIIFLVDWNHICIFLFHRKFIWLRHDFKIIERGLHKERPRNFKIRILIISWPWALLGSLLFIILIMFSFYIWTSLKRFLLRNSKFFGNSLFFFDSEHCSVKNVLKSSAFSPKSKPNLLSWNVGGMHKIFLSFKDVFNIDQ